jgi:hypothetical protein
MNIFVLSEKPKEAAKYHVDRHIVKMPLETAQLLCTAHHLSDSCFEAPYTPTHKNHPCSKWTRTSQSNYLWLCNLGLELCYEYSHRYGKVHKCQAVIFQCFQNIPDIPSLGLTPFVQAMPDEFKNPDPVKAYRDYYMGAKKHLFSWKNREAPLWIENIGS